MVREALTSERIQALPPDEVAAWFVTRRSAGLTASEEQLLADWMNRDEANRRALEGADRAWNWLKPGEDDEILAAMRNSARIRPQRTWPRWESMAAAAAVILVVVGAAVMLGPGLKPKGPGTGGQVIANAGTSYVSGIGEIKAVSLPDGSRMTLDGDSAAIGRFGPSGRSVQLTRGRAFFAVIHDASRPFTVLAADRRLVDLGTQFDVNLGPDQLTVTLLKGRLAVGPVGQATGSATLEPGQQFVSRGGQDQIHSLGAGVEDAAAWRTGLIRFDDQSLAEAAAVMNRYSREQIVIRSPSVAALRVSGQFRAGQPEAFAETLTELYKLRSRRQADQIELLPGG